MVIHFIYLVNLKECSNFEITLFQDLSGRPHLNYDLQIPTQRVGTYDTQVLCFSLTSILIHLDI